MSEAKSESHKPQFDTGDLVVTPGGHVGIVDPSSQYRVSNTNQLFMHYVVKWWGRSGLYREHIYGEVLRRPTFREFIWFRNPNTGGWMFGKTRGWMAGIIHLFSLIIFSCGFTLEEPLAQLFAHVFGLMIIALMWLGTWMNYTKKWV